MLQSPKMKRFIRLVRIATVPNVLHRPPIVAALLAAGLGVAAEPFPQTRVGLREGRWRVNDPAKGPLRVHPQNPRYFTDDTKGPDGSLKAVYLTGSHHWDNLQDGYNPEGTPFD